MKHGKLQRRETVAGFLFLLPNFLGFSVFILFPMLFSLILSFTEWNMVSPIQFVGFQNFINIFQDEMFFKVLRNTFQYMIMIIPSGFTIALILALALNHKLKGTIFFRSVIFLPVVISWAATAMIWTWLLNREFGLINYLLWNFGVPQIGWLNDPNYSMLAIVIVALWHDTGYNMTIMLAGLQTIPRHLYEAASIDGANALQRFRYVTLPMLSPTLFFLVVIAVIQTFQVFDLIFIMTGGGPVNSTRTIVQYVYDSGFTFFRMGYASALAWIMFLFLFIFTWIQFRAQKNVVTYG